MLYPPYAMQKCIKIIDYKICKTKNTGRASSLSKNWANGKKIKKGTHHSLLKLRTQQTHINILHLPLLTTNNAQDIAVFTYPPPPPKKKIIMLKNTKVISTNISQGRMVRPTNWYTGESQACCKRAENALPMVARPDAHFSLDSFCSSSSGTKFSQDWAIVANAAKPCSTTYHDQYQFIYGVINLTRHKFFTFKLPFIFNIMSLGSESECSKFQQK